MQLLIYILTYPLIWFISILPFRILYLISDLIFLLLYYIIGYRKKVVTDNLNLSFPEKTTEELQRIHKKFYRHFVDIFMEMIKTFTISEKVLRKRFKFTNIELLHEVEKNGKSIMMIAGHYANWEWLSSLSLHTKTPCYAVYAKIRNPYFSREVLRSRARFGFHLRHTSKIISTIDQDAKAGTQAIYGFLNDQSPRIRKTHYWSNFMGVKVPIHTGSEMLAKKYDMNVVFMDTQKVKRGHYTCTFSLLTDKASSFDDYNLTEVYLKKVEAQIRKEPAYYFWTHKRFKHKDKAPKD